MFEFDKNASFLWAIIILGLAVPAALVLYASFREHATLKRLQRLSDQTESLDQELRRASRMRTIQLAMFGLLTVLALIVRFARV